MSIHGDDPYLIRESMNAVARRLFPGEETDAAITRFPGATTPLASVLDELCTLPFFSRRRLVVVEDADPFVTKYRRELEAYVEHPCESGTSALAGQAVRRDHESCTSLVDQDRPGDQLLRPARRGAGHLAGPARADAVRRAARAESARLLVELVGPEAGILAAEVEKLAVYAGESRKIDRDDIVKLVGAGRVETIWKTLDAATLGDGQGRPRLPRHAAVIGRTPNTRARGHVGKPAQDSPRRVAPSRPSRARRSLPARRHSVLRF